MRRFFPALSSLVQVGHAAPVNLGLLAGSRLETHGGIRLPASTPRRHVGLQDGVAAVIAKSPQFPVQHNAVFQSFRHPPVDVPGVLVQLRPSQWPRFGPHRIRSLQVPEHRVPSQAQLPGNRPGGMASPLSFRRSLSLVPPLARCVQHLHEIFVNDACAIRWVNSFPAFSLIFASAVADLAAGGCHPQRPHGRPHHRLQRGRNAGPGQVRGNWVCPGHLRRGNVRLRPLVSPGNVQALQSLEGLAKRRQDAKEKARDWSGPSSRAAPLVAKKWPWWSLPLAISATSHASLDPLIRILKQSWRRRAERSRWKPTRRQGWKLTARQTCACPAQEKKSPPSGSPPFVMTLGTLSAMCRSGCRSRNLFCARI